MGITRQAVNPSHSRLIASVQLPHLVKTDRITELISTTIYPSHTYPSHTCLP